MLAGAAVPILILVAVYVREDAIAAWIHGTFEMPKQRMQFATAPFPAVSSIIFTLPLVVLLFPGMVGKLLNADSEGPILALTTMVCTILMAIQSTSIGFAATFQSFRQLGPFLVIGNLAPIIRMGDRLRAPAKQQMFLATAVAFFASLIQFPFARPIYFFYAAPLFVIVALMTTQVQAWVPQRTLVVVVAFLLLFSCSRFDTPLPNISMQPGYQFRRGIAFNTEWCQIRVDERMAPVFDGSSN